MKKVFLFVLLLSGIFYFSSCTKDAEEVLDEETVAEIVGTWENVTQATVNGSTFNSVWKWVVSKENTGKYSYVSNGNTKEESEFKWVKNESSYSIDYSSDEIEDVEVVISSFLGETILETTDGKVLGLKSN